MSVTLTHETSPEQAEALVYAALAAKPTGVTVKVHGFSSEALSVILGRLPAEYVATGEGTSRVRIEGMGATTDKAGKARVKVITSNIQRTPLMSLDKARHDIERVLSKATGGVVLWQEIGAYAPRVMNSLGSQWRTYSHPGLRDELITYDARRFDLIDAGGHIATPGGVHKDEGVKGRNRGFVWATLRDKTTGRTLTVVNNHATNKGWTKKPLPPAERALRQKLWHDQVQATDEFLAQLDGPVVGGGDFNRPGKWSFGGAAPVKFDGGLFRLDRLYHLAGSGVEPVRNLFTTLGNLFSDHNAQAGTYRF